MNTPLKQKTTILLDGKSKEINCMGNPDLLNTYKLSVTGSRASPERALDILRNNLRKAIKLKYTIVSGYANGADETAHYTSLQEPSGKTIIVLPNGLNGFFVKSVYKQVWDWNRVLVISEFSNDAPWTSSNAFQRNITIVDLSNAIISVHPNEKGGTFNATTLAFKKNKKVWITNSNSNGEKIFSQQGKNFKLLN